jgi:hypothetical protein
VVAKVLKAHRLLCQHELENFGLHAAEEISCS